MLTTAQRERIVCHLERGWKLPDSLIQELWEAYVALERAYIRSGAQPEASAIQPGPPAEHDATAEQVAR